MAFEIQFIFPKSKKDLSEAIEKIKQIFDLEEIHDEHGNIILISKHKGLRVTFYVANENDSNMINGFAIIRNEKDIDTLRKFVEISSVIRKKPTVAEFANIVLKLSTKNNSKERVVEELKTIYGINGLELNSYLKALKKLSKSKRSNEEILKALKFLTE